MIEQDDEKYSFKFFAEYGKEILRILPDGRVFVNEVTWESAEEFWKLVMQVAEKYGFKLIKESK